MELPILIFLVVLAGEILSTIGKDTITEFVHGLTQIFSSSPLVKQQKALKSKILKDKAELAATSAQDEFSKWAKLRRRLDKGIADLETLNGKSSGSKAAFASTFKKVLWVVMTVLPFIFSSYHRKAAVFYLPDGWFGPASWYLGLPKAPTGALSVTLFTMATKRTLKVVKEIAVDIWKTDSIPVVSKVEEIPLKEKSEGKSEL